MGLFPICFTAALAASRYTWKARMPFALFGLACVVEHSFYETILGHAGALDLRARLDAPAWALAGPAWAFAGIDALLLTGYGWLLWLSLKAMQGPSEAA
jgi:hypothetical protein